MTFKSSNGIGEKRVMFLNRGQKFSIFEVLCLLNFISFLFKISFGAPGSLSNTKPEFPQSVGGNFRVLCIHETINVQTIHFETFTKFSLLPLFSYLPPR